MLMRFKNRTNETQQINFIDGSCIKITPRMPRGGFADIDTSNLYKSELVRVQKFFEISPVESETKEKIVDKTFPGKKRR